MPPHDSSKTVTRICLRCGTPFERLACQVIKRGTGQYCSRDCSPNGGAIPESERFWGKVLVAPNELSCWLWTGTRSRQGYGWFRRTRGGWTQAHRLSWELSNRPIPEGMWILHHCDNPPCVRPSHLFIGTRQDNVDDREAKGRNRPKRGDSHPLATLTNTEALVIRGLYTEKRGEISTLARAFGVSRRTIHRIVHGVSYADAIGT